MEEFWHLYVETRLARSTRRKYRCLWNAHINRRLGAMELRQITPLVLSEFVLELEEAGAGAATIRSCLGLLQSMFARAVEWDRTSVNVVKLIAKPRVRRTGGLIFARQDGTPWRDHDWRDWRSRVWQPACQAIGIATITKTTTVSNGKRKTKRTYEGPVPYDLRHSFASLLIHDGKHSIVQISEWMGHSPATLLTHYAHVIADLASKPSLPNENTIKAARGTMRLTAQNSQIVPRGNSVITYWY